MSLLLFLLHLILLSLFFFFVVSWYKCHKQKHSIKKEDPKTPFMVKVLKIEKRLEDLKEQW